MRRPPNEHEARKLFVEPSNSADDWHSKDVYPKMEDEVEVS
jgi:hypothetical protein